MGKNTIVKLTAIIIAINRCYTKVTSEKLPAQMEIIIYTRFMPHLVVLFILNINSAHYSYKSFRKNVK